MTRLKHVCGVALILALPAVAIIDAALKPAVGQTLTTQPAPAQAGKSERQKCLDMFLPQDGAACLEKLKKKQKND